MALSKEMRFLLDVFAEYGVMPLLHGGTTPAFVDGPEADKDERYGPWCKRVLERSPAEVLVLSGHVPDPKTLVRTLANDSVALVLRAMLKEHRKLGQEDADRRLEAKLESAVAGSAKLQAKVHELEERNRNLEGGAKRRYAVGKARRKAAEVELVAASLRDFLSEEGERLEAIVVTNGLAAVEEMAATGEVEKGYSMLFHFINQRCKTR